MGVFILSQKEKVETKRAENRYNVLRFRITVRKDEIHNGSMEEEGRTLEFGRGRKFVNENIEQRISKETGVLTKVAKTRSKISLAT